MNSFVERREEAPVGCEMGESFVEATVRRRRAGGETEGAEGATALKGVTPAGVGDRENTPDTGAHTRTTRPPNEHLPQALNNAQRWREDGACHLPRPGGWPRLQRVKNGGKYRLWTTTIYMYIYLYIYFFYRYI